MVRLFNERVGFWDDAIKLESVPQGYVCPFADDRDLLIEHWVECEPAVWDLRKRVNNRLYFPKDAKLRGISLRLESYDRRPPEKYAITLQSDSLTPGHWQKLLEASQSRGGIFDFDSADDDIKIIDLRPLSADFLEGVTWRRTHSHGQKHVGGYIVKIGGNAVALPCESKQIDETRCHEWSARFICGATPREVASAAKKWYSCGWIVESVCHTVQGNLFFNKISSNKKTTVRDFFSKPLVLGYAHKFTCEIVDKAPTLPPEVMNAISEYGDVSHSLVVTLGGCPLEGVKAEIPKTMEIGGKLYISGKDSRYARLTSNIQQKFVIHDSIKVFDALRGEEFFKTDPMPKLREDVRKYYMAKYSVGDLPYDMEYYTEDEILKYKQCEDSKEYVRLALDTTNRERSLSPFDGDNVFRHYGLEIKNTPELKNYLIALGAQGIAVGDCYIFYHVSLFSVENLIKYPEFSFKFSPNLYPVLKNILNCGAIHSDIRRALLSYKLQ